MIICVTNRHLCGGDFLEQINKVCQKAEIIILREKDLSEGEYFDLAQKVQKICKANGRKFYVNSFYNTAKKLSADGLQLSYSDFIRLAKSGDLIENTGCSVHSVHEAEKACKLGAKFIIAGHIFSTDCKKDVPPRGLDFLGNVLKHVEIPVYAIGGINESNLPIVLSAGAKGGCMMSSLMRDS